MLIPFLILLSTTLDGHSTYLALNSGYRETNVFLKNFSPNGIIRASAIMAAALLFLFFSNGYFNFFTENTLHLSLITISVAKLIAAGQNYFLLYSGISVLDKAVELMRLNRKNDFHIIIALIPLLVIPSLVISEQILILM